MLPINQEVLLHFEAVGSSIALSIIGVVVIVRTTPLPAWAPTLLQPAPCLPGFFILIIAITGWVQLWHLHHAVIISISSSLLPLSWFLYNQFILQSPQQKTYSPSIPFLRFSFKDNIYLIWVHCIYTCITRSGYKEKLNPYCTLCFNPSTSTSAFLAHFFQKSGSLISISVLLPDIEKLAYNTKFGMSIVISNIDVQCACTAYQNFYSKDSTWSFEISKWLALHMLKQ